MSLSSEQLAGLLPRVIEIADAAGREIMRIYQAGFSVTLKQDRSPLTDADLAAQRLIDAGLAQLTPRLPVLGEESDHQNFQLRRQWPSLWLVDPLDGTREFVKRNGEFTVNIALVEQHEPVLGVLALPARNELYAAARGCGAFHRDSEGRRREIHTQSAAETPLRVLGSRSHGDAVLDRAVSRLGPQVRIAVGSAIKFGLLAEGRGDLYVRRGPTSEWDTAAGHAIVLEAGGVVLDLRGEPLRYNARDSLINPSFIAFADRSRDWLAEIGPLS